VNRLKNLKLPKAAIRIMEPLTSQEIKKVMNSIDRRSYSGERNHAVLVTLLDSGLRISEVATITLNNLNLKDGYIRVNGKGDKERIVPIGKFVGTELMHYIEKVRPQAYGIECNNLFLCQGGRPMTPNTVKMVFSKLARSSGVNRLHAHLCRHTFAVNYLLNGGDIFSRGDLGPYHPGHGKSLSPLYQFADYRPAPQILTDGSDLRKRLARSRVAS
jgi:site-specific recombinase XerD